MEETRAEIWCQKAWTRELGLASAWSLSSGTGSCRIDSREPAVLTITAVAAAMSAREGKSVAGEVGKLGREVSAAEWHEIWGQQRIGGRQRDLEGRYDLEDWGVSVRGTTILSPRSRRPQWLKILESGGRTSTRRREKKERARGISDRRKDSGG